MPTRLWSYEDHGSTAALRAGDEMMREILQYASIRIGRVCWGDIVSFEDPPVNIPGVEFQNVVRSGCLACLAPPASLPRYSSRGRGSNPSLLYHVQMWIRLSVGFPA